MRKMEKKEQIFRAQPITDQERQLGLAILKVGQGAVFPDYLHVAPRKAMSTLKVVTAGKGWIETSVGVFPFKAGDVVLYWQGHPYKWWTDRQDLLQHYWIDLEGETVKALFNLLAEPDRCVLTRSAVPELEIVLIEELLTLFRTQPTHFVWKSISIFFAIWHSVVQSVLLDVVNTRSPVQLAREFVDMHYMTEIGLCDIARHVNVTPEYLIAAFKRKYQQTPYEYLLACRLQAATRQLQEGLTVKEAAAYVGYDDPNYFARLYKKKTGQTPSSVF